MLLSLDFFLKITPLNLNIFNVKFHLKSDFLTLINLNLRN